LEEDSRRTTPELKLLEIFATGYYKAKYPLTLITYNDYSGYDKVYLTEEEADIFKKYLTHTEKRDRR
jgi:hypothetical protein